MLKTIEEKAAKEDFLPEAGFDEICRANGIAMEGPGGRDGLLDLFDKLGIVMHFARLPFLTDYVLNPRWLTYGVYSIMYSDEAKAAKGRLSEADLVAVLKKANPSIPNGHAFKYPPDRCQIIANAMNAFGVAYELRKGAFVIPALLPADQPEHDFKPDGALAFRFDFGGFLPRHVVPALIVEHFQDIAKVNGREIVWQNGVLLRPRRHLAEALVRADYHTRTINIFVKGSDAPFYLGILRESIHSTLETMPQLPFEEKVELRPDMRTHAVGRLRAENSVWMSYEIIQTAQRSKLPSIVGPDGIYDMDRILAVMPVNPGDRQADVFLSYTHKDGPLIEKLASDLEAKGVSVWYDRRLLAGQPFRDVVRQRIDTTKAVVVLWTENSVGSSWVIAEADCGRDHNKLICLRDPNLDPRRIPMPFASNDHVIAAGDMDGLVKALASKGAKPRI